MSSYTQYLRAQAIQTGADWRIRIKVVSSALEAFPASATFISQVRENNADGAVKTVMTTANGNIKRVDAQTLDVSLTAAQTADWSEGFVVLDILRTDLTYPVHLGFDMRIPVKRSITRLS